MRVYLGATAALYAYAAGTFLTASPNTSGVFEPGLWGVTAALVAVAQLVALALVSDYAVIRFAATAAAMWAAAYEADIIYITATRHLVFAGLVVWSWILIVHILFTRYRLAVLQATVSPTPETPLEPIATDTVDQLKEITERARAPKPSKPPTRRTSAAARPAKSETA